MPNNTRFTMGSDDMDLDDPFITESDPSAPTQSFDTMPPDVFAIIASHLDPVWLYNLTHVNRRCRILLSFEEGGNRIWYNAMPPSIWAEGEKHQDERELENSVIKHLELQRARGVPCTHEVMLWATKINRRRSEEQFRKGLKRLNTWFYAQQVPRPPPYHGVDPSGLPYSGSYATIYHYGYPSIESLEHYCDLPRKSLRENPVTALGGPYQEFFNYKREIMERIKNSPDVESRCNICLNLDSSTFDVHVIQQWGLMWCPPCFEKYTVSYKDVAKIMESDELLYHSRLLAHNATDNTYYYYRPGLDHILYMSQWPSLDAVVAMNRKQQLTYHLDVVQVSPLEMKRRDFRIETIRVAKLLWEGVDPFPQESTDNSVETETRGNSAYHVYISPDKYRVFRERFCPTKDLGKMLFSDLKLYGDPEAKEDDATGGWLEDPSKVVVKQMNMHKPVPSHLKVFVADRMLRQLTDFSCKNYDVKGMGGQVRNWLNAVRQYHMNRIESDIESGAILRMSYVPIQERHATLYNRFHDLRWKVGLEDEVGNLIVPQFTRPDLNARQLNNPQLMMKQDEYAIVAHKEYKQKVDAFNKIIRVDCATCPSGSGLFHPPGLDGMLEHVRTSHPSMYWYSDSFTVVG